MSICAQELLHDWSILIGDIAHSAGASPDHAVHRFVEANGGTLTDRTQFPAALKPRDVKGSTGLDGVHDRVRGPRGTLCLRQSTGTVYLHLPSARADEWDGNTVDGYRIPAMEVLRACLQACVVALGTMTDAAIAGAAEQRSQPKS